MGERSTEPEFKTMAGGPGLCMAQGCPNDGNYWAEWKHVTKRVCDYHKKLVEEKPWSDVRHLFGSPPPPRS